LVPRRPAGRRGAAFDWPVRAVERHPAYPARAPSKQALSVYDKAMVYYRLSVLCNDALMGAETRAHRMSLDYVTGHAIER
jgi:hypothetical protein